MSFRHSALHHKTRNSIVCCGQRALEPWARLNLPFMKLSSSGVSQSEEEADTWRRVDINMGSRIEANKSQSGVGTGDGGAGWFGHRCFTCHSLSSKPGSLQPSLFLSRELTGKHSVASQLPEVSPFPLSLPLPGGKAKNYLKLNLVLS